MSQYFSRPTTLRSTANPHPKGWNPMSSLRPDLYSYIKKKYNADPEYLWRRFPGYAAFRHSDNAKWFAIIMDVSPKKLGLPGTELRDIINVKLTDPILVDYLVQQPGFLRGYHISRGNWVSILLDGTVPLDEICRWLDDSYMNTASKQKLQMLRPAKEWLIPANPKYYDVQAAFKESKEIDWKQGKGIKVGDTVFMYVAAPVSAILYKCKVTETDIPYKYNGKVHITSLMRIKLLREYEPNKFTFDILGKDYDIHAVRGPRGIPKALSEALNR